MGNLSEYADGSPFPLWGNQSDAPWETIQTIREVTQVPYPWQTTVCSTVKMHNRTDVTQVLEPLSLNGIAVPVNPLCAPALRQHTEELIREVVGGGEYIADLKARRIIQ